MCDLSPVNGKLYVDHAATTSMLPEVVESMLPYLGSQLGNPSSTAHRSGLEAAEILDHARGQVASLIGVLPHEIVFTSGATESINLAILGLRDYIPRSRNRIITSQLEHKAVLEVVKELERSFGVDVEFLGVASEGQLDLVSLLSMDSADLISLQLANSVTGISTNLSEVSEHSAASGAFVHIDATQGLAALDLTTTAQRMDLISFGSHKLGGPMGIGALFVNSRTVADHLKPIMFGGGQEFGLRPGTQNVPAAVGFGVACEMAKKDRIRHAAHLKRLTLAFEDAITRELLSVRILGGGADRIPGISCVHFPDIEAGAILARMNNVEASFGAACDSGSLLASPTLIAFGLSENDAFRTIRFSFGRTTSIDDVRRLAQNVVTVYKVIGSLM